MKGCPLILLNFKDKPERPDRTFFHPSQKRSQIKMGEVKKEVMVGDANSAPDTSRVGSKTAGMVIWLYEKESVERKHI